MEGFDGVEIACKEFVILNATIVERRIFILCGTERDPSEYLRMTQTKSAGYDYSIRGQGILTRMTKVIVSRQEMLSGGFDKGTRDAIVKNVLCRGLEPYTAYDPGLLRRSTSSQTTLTRKLWLCLLYRKQQSL